MLNYMFLAEAKSTTLGTAIFVVLSMLILLACIKHFAWGPVTDMLQQRADKISNDIDSAEIARIKAKELENKRLDQLQHSKSEAMDIVQQAKDSAEKNRLAVLAEAQTETSKLKAKANEDIELQKEQTMATIKGDVAELSVQIAEKILSKELSPESHKTLIDSYIEGLDK